MSDTPTLSTFITGASRRIGRAIALDQARRGRNLVLHYGTDREGVEETAAAAVEMGRRVHILQADLGDAADCERLAVEVIARAPDLGRVVLNAANFHRTPIESARPDDFDRSMQVNGRSTWILGLLLGRALQRVGGAGMVFLADVAGLKGWPTHVPYSASKAAVVNMVQGFAGALAPTVRVNGVAPGPILHPAGADPVQGEVAVARTVLGRWGDPSDIANAVHFLLEAAYVTGYVLPVDGGRTING